MIETARFPKTSSPPYWRPYLGSDSGICSRATASTEATTSRCRWWWLLEPHSFESLHTHTAHATQNDDINSLKLRRKQHCGRCVLGGPRSWSSSAANLEVLSELAVVQRSPYPRHPAIPSNVPIACTGLDPPDLGVHIPAAKTETNPRLLAEKPTG
jgi:hypothetical protein